MRASSVPKIVAALVAALVVAALVTSCDQATPSPSPSATSSGLPPATLSPSVGPTESPPAEQPTSMALIGAARAAGTLDEPTAILYRLYAFVGDERLPQAYRGTWSEDALAIDQAVQRYDGLPADIQAQVLPLLVRPTSPDSYWAAPATATLAAVGPLTAQACAGGFVRKQVTPAIPVVVWGQCGALSESAVVAQVDEVVAFVEELWEPMTILMGPPIGDQNVEGDAFTDTPETGDGLLDIYLIDFSVSAHGRGLSLPSGAWAGAPATPPFVGPAGAAKSSTYIVVGGGAGSAQAGGIALKATIAHELFHSLQAAHNRTGTYWDTSNGPAFFWFVEASAAWSEHHFVHEASRREDGAYDRFTRVFQRSALPLSTTDGRNEFGSWAWPLFMRQELGARSIAAAWGAMQGKSGYNQLQAALDSQLSFAGRFRDFAVRSFNEDLQPGDPAQPRFQTVDRTLPTFPLNNPDAPRGSYNNRVSTGLAVAMLAELPSLWSSYTELVPEPDVHQIVFDFTLLSPATALDVDLLLLIKGRWERRAGSLDAEQTICDVDRAIVVLSNHDQKLNSKVTGGWFAEGKSSCAPQTWRLVLEGPRPGAGTYSGQGEAFCSNPPGIGWNAVVVTNSTDVLGLSVGEESILVSTRFTHDNPSDWASGTGVPMNARITIMGDAATSPVVIIADSSWTVPEPGVYAGSYHVHAEITCTDYSP